MPGSTFTSIGTFDRPFLKRTARDPKARMNPCCPSWRCAEPHSQCAAQRLLGSSRPGPKPAGTSSYSQTPRPQHVASSPTTAPSSPWMRLLTQRPLLLLRGVVWHVKWAKCPCCGRPVSADASLLCALSGRYVLALWPCVHARWMHVRGLRGLWPFECASLSDVGLFVMAV